MKINFIHNRSFGFWLGFILIVTLIIRSIIFIEFLYTNPFSEVFFSDDWVYWIMAGSKAAGNWTPENPFLSAPLFPYLLGVVRWMGGELKTVYVIQLFLGIASLLLIAFGTKKRFGETSGLIAAALFAFSEEPTMTFTRVMADSVQIFLVTLVWFLWCRMLDNEKQPVQSLKQIFITGIIIGFLVLAWPPSQLLLIAYGIWLLFTPDTSIKNRLINSFTGLIAGLLIISPATIHNYKTDGEFIPVSANSGINLLQGNNKNAQGTITTLDGIRTDRQHMFEDAAQVYKQAHGQIDSWKKIDDYYGNKAKIFIFSQLQNSIPLLLKKFYWFLSSEDYDNISVLSLEQDHGLYQAARLVPVELPWLMGLTLLGVIILIREFHRHTPELLLLGLTIFVCVVFHYSARYRLPAAPVLCILSAVAITQWQRIYLPSIAKYPVAFLPLLFVFINYLTDFSSVEFMQKDTATKISHAYVEVGDRRVREENYDAAVFNYQRAVTADPAYDTPYLRLAHLGVKTKNSDLDFQPTKDITLNPRAKIVTLKLRYNAEILKQNFSKAIATLHALIKEIPNDLQLQQNLIWMLATCPDQDIRDPKLALDLSRKLLTASQGTGRIGGLVTLATAQLSSGNKKAAMHAIEKAIKMARRSGLTNSLGTLVNLQKDVETKTIFDFKAILFKVDSPWDMTKPHPMDLLEF